MIIIRSKMNISHWYFYITDNFLMIIIRAIIIIIDVSDFYNLVTVTNSINDKIKISQMVYNWWKNSVTEF